MKNKSHSVQATINTISIINTANGKTMRDLAKATIFQIEKFLQAFHLVYFVSDYFRLHLLISMINFIHKYRYTNCMLRS
jgi:hypothetical protein